MDGCPYYRSGTNDVFQVSSNDGAFTAYDFQYDLSGSLTTANTSNPASGGYLGYDSYLVIGRLCVPNSVMFTTAFSSVSTTTTNAFKQGDLNNFITDIINNWKWLIAALGWAILISFIFMFMLRCLAGCIVWCSLFGIIFFFIGLGLVFLYNAGYLGAAA